MAIVGATEATAKPEYRHRRTAGGEAARIAMDIGHAVLLTENGTGIKKLVEEIRKFVFPQAKAEAKELYQLGRRKNGTMARQTGEPMVSYVSRRRRW